MSYHTLLVDGTRDAVLEEPMILRQKRLAGNPEHKPNLQNV
jgi:hypothetical protein